jgi:uncharacterized membrane protein YccC
LDSSIPQAFGDGHFTEFEGSCRKETAGSSFESLSINSVGVRRNVSAQVCSSLDWSDIGDFLQAILPKGLREQDHARMKFWSWQKENLPSIPHSIRTAAAATLSVVVARLVHMPESYWAAIATLVVMQSSLGATLTLSIERVVATALGASVGAVEANYFGANLAAFMLAIFFIGLLSFGFRLEKTAYRYASVTLTIIVLIPRTNPAWIVALHRFIEVSVGIIVALAVVAFWPERSAIPAKNAAE